MAKVFALVVLVVAVSGCDSLEDCAERLSEKSDALSTGQQASCSMECLRESGSYAQNLKACSALESCLDECM